MGILANGTTIDSGGGIATSSDGKIVYRLPFNGGTLAISKDYGKTWLGKLLFSTTMPMMSVTCSADGTKVAVCFSGRSTTSTEYIIRLLIQVIHGQCAPLQVLGRGVN